MKFVSLCRKKVFNKEKQVNKIQLGFSVVTETKFKKYSLYYINK